MTIKNVSININNHSRCHLVSPDDLNVIDFMFGDLFHSTTTLPTHVTSTICLRMPVYIVPNTNNQVWGFERPPP